MLDRETQEAKASTRKLERSTVNLQGELAQAKQGRTSLNLTIAGIEKAVKKTKVFYAFLIFFKGN